MFTGNRVISDGTGSATELKIFQEGSTGIVNLDVSLDRSNINILQIEFYICYSHEKFTRIYLSGVAWRTNERHVISLKLGK